MTIKTEKTHAVTLSFLPTDEQLAEYQLTINDLREVFVNGTSPKEFAIERTGVSKSFPVGYEGVWIDGFVFPIEWFTVIKHTEIKTLGVNESGRLSYY